MRHNDHYDGPRMDVKSVLKLKQASLDRYRSGPSKRNGAANVPRRSFDKPVPVYRDKDVIEAPSVKMRSSADKLASLVRPTPDLDLVEVSPGQWEEKRLITAQDALRAGLPSDHALNGPKTVKSRANSPFKRAKREVVIVRK